MAGVRNRDGIEGTDILGRDSYCSFCLGDPSLFALLKSDFWCILIWDGLKLKSLTAFSYWPGPGTSTTGRSFTSLRPFCANGWTFR
jgi:hypothetical protein